VFVLLIGRNPTAEVGEERVVAEGDICSRAAVPCSGKKDCVVIAGVIDFTTLLSCWKVGCSVNVSCATVEVVERSTFVRPIPLFLKSKSPL
jgi:hypothetical protein